MRGLRTKPWSQAIAEPMQRKRVITAEDITAAYQQGRKDHAAGRSLSLPRYSDKDRDEAWQRGQLDAMRAKRNPESARCR